MNNNQIKHNSPNTVKGAHSVRKQERRVQAQMTEHGMLVWMGNEIYFIPDWADEAWPISKLYSAQMARDKYTELFGGRRD